jgi:hypothetical protein
MSSGVSFGRSILAVNLLSLPVSASTSKGRRQVEVPAGLGPQPDGPNFLVGRNPAQGAVFEPARAIVGEAREDGEGVRAAREVDRALSAEDHHVARLARPRRQRGGEQAGQGLPPDGGC